MSNKEILAELKCSYEYLQDIRDNGCIDHCSGQLRAEYAKRINHIAEEIDSVYFDIWNDLFANGEELSIPKKYQNDEQYTILIGSSASADYTIQNNETGVFDEEITTCAELDYYWYNEVLGICSNYMYESVANGLMNALDEICRLSKKVGEEFDYYDKTRELTGLGNYNALDLLDKFGSDNEDEE